MSLAGDLAVLRSEILWYNRRFLSFGSHGCGKTELSLDLAQQFVNHFRRLHTGLSGPGYQHDKPSQRNAGRLSIILWMWWIGHTFQCGGLRSPGRRGSSWTQIPEDGHLSGGTGLYIDALLQGFPLS